MILIGIRLSNKLKDFNEKQKTPHASKKHEERKEFPYEKKFSKYESYCFCQKRRRHQNWSCTNDAKTTAAKTTAALINRIPAYDLYKLDTLPYRKI